MIKIALSGATGKMGTQLQSYINQDSRFLYVSGYALASTDCSKIKNNVEELFNNVDIIIDFSNPTCTSQILNCARNYKIPLLIGTTGLNQTLLSIINELSNYIPILVTSNTSIGIALTKKVVSLLASELNESFDTEIIETHHRHKVDSPSGTAITLGNAIAQAKNLDFSQIAVFDRHNLQSPRKKNQIGFSSIRGGEIIGEHTVSFISNEEEITITHKAFSRGLFAKGALEAAAWLIHQKPGLYSMHDVFN